MKTTVTTALFLRDKLAALRELCRRYRVKSLYAFGSVITPQFNDASDVDLLLEFEPDISVEEYTDHYFLLRQELTALLRRPVDLITRRSLSNPYFIADVEQTKQLIYGA